MKIWRLFFLAFLLSGCTGAVQTAQAPAPLPQAAPTSAPTDTVPVRAAPTLKAAVTATATGAPAPVNTSAATNTPASTAAAVSAQSSPTDTQSAAPAETRKPPKYWAEWPLIPDSVSERAKVVFRLGQKLGNDPHSFTTIGDCQSQPNIFMGKYDSDSYTLPPEDAALQATIQQFKGSFARDSITVRDGESVASVFAPAWADSKQCQPGETPLDCEFRLHKPVIVFINLGTNWKGGDDVKHEEYLRKIVDYAVSKGVVPIISSKGDNLEGEYRINQSNARVAYDYALPFYNFWRSIRTLPGKGIDGTRPGGYLIPDAWPIRSLTGLQALDAVWRELKPLTQ